MDELPASVRREPLQQAVMLLQSTACQRAMGGAAKAGLCVVTRAGQQAAGGCAARGVGCLCRVQAVVPPEAEAHPLWPCSRARYCGQCPQCFYALASRRFNTLLCCRDNDAASSPENSGEFITPARSSVRQKSQKPQNVNLVQPSVVMGEDDDLDDVEEEEGTVHVVHALQPGGCPRKRIP
ncbi:hypothetical protein NDU88_003783 [Pleurodeles waltl]|uniref:Uncharacterized protein n=1 Tax=Pleurodeles waltl TaxID=8319 RepID=A0AAV7MVK8_PLEWA|nr:hypothetical protein NDU88_003783 [Pleurodeles waltl]